MAPLVCGAIVTITNAILLQTIGITTVSSAIGFALLLGVRYLMSTVINVAVNPNIPRPLLYSVVNAPFFVIGNVVSCTILAAMSQTATMRSAGRLFEIIQILRRSKRPLTAQQIADELEIRRRPR